ILTMTENDIFTSEAALLPDFFPEQPLHRESQLAEIELALKPAVHNAKPDNLFLYGSTGTGKTTCCRFTATQLNEHKPAVNCIYINCWETNTRLGILSEVAAKSGVAFPRRGLAGDEVFARIIEMNKKDKSTCIVFLDEFDQLVRRKEEGVVYELTRAGEIHGANFGVVLVSNDGALLQRLDSRIRSSLSPKKIAFSRYSPLELKDILQNRAKLCFRPGSWNGEVIALIAAHTAKNGGDCRIALRTLWRAARLAEQQGSRIEEKHVRLAFQEKEPPASENELDKKIIQTLSKNPAGITTGKLYELVGENERTVRNRLSELQAKNLIDVHELHGKEIGGRGRTRVVKLK
ncbi:AAA family ATPase, partial [Candidatus Micrarchaeota archaeon]|nr:AAA family ATPase [Candidatus Micrarchaeota archaeon]